ncbi:hypothetical protein G7078_02445 [Sphingomonas sinipercae]|uniref:Lipoprotein n=1 Tax=Sphingomonas sinipercae TaxID=2714944 RepID=A0A6G7ZLI1_9SPHN|nr:DUF6491 family protein [Sphingomonas sinipercae]QIL01756.1 hypothetical protein G7078_02445 [Sphingomonas sinipercae]
MRRFTATAASLCALAAAGCTQVPSPAVPVARSNGGTCFNANQVRHFSTIADDVVDVQVGGSRFYRLQLSGTCNSSVSNPRAVLRTLGGGSWICGGLDAQIVFPDAFGSERCLVTGVTQIPKPLYGVRR